MSANIFFICISLALYITNCQYKSAPYATWAHSHVVWMHESDQSEKAIYELIKGYQQNGIPVGGINLQPTWTTCINNYIVNRDKFPNMQQMIQNLHKQNIKIIKWTTSIINKECPEYEQGLAKNVFLNKGKTVHWWKGQGAFIDFFNKDAKKWLEGLMDRAINMGIDGWKCDGAEPLIYMLRPLPFSHGAKRFISFPEYADQYYGTFYNYTKSINPETLIMSRPVDSYRGYAYAKYSPKYVMFAGWVGDQHNDVEGFRIAMENIIHSASENYLNFGFDIGAYKADSKTPKYLFLRWAQIGALLPFMENGGGGKHQPWLFDQQTVDIYRKFVNLHYDLREFFLSSATEAYSKKRSVIQPISKDKRRLEVTHNYNLGYVLWDTFLVSPIFEQNGFVEIVFPKGYFWLYFFNRSKIYDGGVTRNLGIKLNDTALFIRSNSVIPFKGQIWLVFLSEGMHNKTVIAGNYSDEVSIEYKQDNLTIRIDRFYINEQVKNNKIEERMIKVRLIGLEKDNRLSTISSTEIQNQFEVQIPLNRQVHLKYVKFLSRTEQKSQIHYL